MSVFCVLDNLSGLSLASRQFGRRGGASRKKLTVWAVRLAENREAAAVYMSLSSFFFSTTPSPSLLRSITNNDNSKHRRYVQIDAAYSNNVGDDDDNPIGVSASRTRILVTTLSFPWIPAWLSIVPFYCCLFHFVACSFDICTNSQTNPYPRSSTLAMDTRPAPSVLRLLSQYI